MWTDSFFFGKDRVMYSEGTKREGSLFFQSIGSGGMVHIKIKAAIQSGAGWEYRGPLWEGEAVLSPEGFQTPKFTYEGPEETVAAVIVELSTSPASKEIWLRGILNDKILYTSPSKDPAKLFGLPEEPWQSNKEEPKQGNFSKPLRLVSPTVDIENLQIGQELDIAWEADSKVVSGISAYISIDRGRTWFLINQGSSIPVDKREYFWKVPKSISGPEGSISLEDKKIYIKISSYGDGNAYDVTPQAISLVSHSVALNSLRPSVRRVKALDESLALASGRSVCLPFRPSARRIGLYKLYSQPQDDCNKVNSETAMK